MCLFVYLERALSPVYAYLFFDLLLCPVSQNILLEMSQLSQAVQAQGSRSRVCPHKTFSHCAAPLHFGDRRFLFLWVDIDIFSFSVFKEIV